VTARSKPVGKSPSKLCLTVDVEDWYDGMEVLGHRLARPIEAASGLVPLASLIDSGESRSSVTLFVVGNYACQVRSELEELTAQGHEIASHGPDHGQLPKDPGSLLKWLRQGREILEDMFQSPVRGFRSPRFDIPEGMGLDRFRDLTAEAGYRYTSDTHRFGPLSPVLELPVLRTHGLPIGGGSYQRLLPGRAVAAVVEASAAPRVLYYHSYDFGADLPGLGAIRSAAVAKQVLGRKRVAKVFEMLIRRYGSEACANVAE